jgi:KUP system potassium uptake protein
MRETAPSPQVAALTLGALGVVFGDLGTSPLYTLKTVLDLAGPTTPATVLGLLSLLVWTLVIITSVKYVLFVMRVDNDGEGGILALMSLLGVQRQQRPLIVVVGLFGAALIYGDGIITPAISVLSALEGLDIATPAFTPYVLPMSVAILALLFLVQPMGTAKIGQLFGPVMATWFVVIAALGIWGIALHPGVLAALNPWLGLDFLLHGGMAGFLVLGGVFLCVTGAEALYADMGHFGAKPIRLAWYGLVLPSLLLNYAGQSALLLAGGSSEGNVFFQLCPPALLIPMVILSAVATVIASQSIITGAFSMTRQAIQLGWCPRMRITQTSAMGYGQIYVSTVNWLMMVLTIALALAFKKSGNLASAYGIAVSLTMLLTTCLLYVAMREIWRWSRLGCLAVAGGFFVIDATFFAANSMKVFEGGWVPLLLAALVFGLMATWHGGVAAISAALRSRSVKVPEFLEQIRRDGIPRVPGTAVFLTRTTEDTPPVMLWHVRNNRALHTYLVALSVQVEPVPWVADDERLSILEMGGNFSRLTARYGFMEQPDIPALLAAAQAHGCTLQLDDVTYYLGHETVLHRTDGRGLPLWREVIFAFMLRNAAHPAEFFRLPREGVVEIGRQIEI